VGINDFFKQKIVEGDIFFEKKIFCHKFFNLKKFQILIKIRFLGESVATFMYIGYTFMNYLKIGR
jgi:hypothetical protein